MSSKIGECEVCDKKDTKISLHYGNMWFCDECWEREETLTIQNQSENAQNARVTESRAIQETNVANHALEASKALDNSIQVRTDLFNAATTAIMDLKKSIDENADIANKPYALAEALTERFNHFKQVVFELNEKIVAAGNEQKAIQIYLNQLANSLRVEEREKLKIADINYKPTPPKTVKPVKTTGTKKSTKLDKVELRKYAAELGVGEFTLQMVCVSKGMTPEQAANVLRKSINEAKSENS